jgi:hypothetical protein
MDATAERLTAGLPLARLGAPRCCGGRHLVIDGVIADVPFEATTCVTLVAYCEVAAEWATGLTVLAAAQRVRVRALVTALAPVPASKRQRAPLAALALSAALAEAARTGVMKVAYIFATQRHTVSSVLGRMILPQLEENRHGVTVVGMFFFEDNRPVRGPGRQHARPGDHPLSGP